jgi:uncharacterized protein (DUF885 family)
MNYPDRIHFPRAMSGRRAVPGGTEHRPARFGSPAALAALIWLGGLASCRVQNAPRPSTAAPGPVTPPQNPENLAPKSSPAPADPRPASPLRMLADAYWAAHLDADPIEATLLGYPGYADRMPDESAATRTRQEERLRVLRARIEREVSEAGLTAAERVTRGLLLGEIERALAFASCHLEDWAVDPREGPQVAYLDLAALQSVKTPADGAAMLSRWRQMPVALRQITDNLRRGLAAGKTSARSEVERVVRQLDELLATPVVSWPLVSPAGRATGPGWNPASTEQFRGALLAVTRDAIRPAFVRYRDMVADEILPLARGDADVGISRIAGGPACYLALAQVHTSMTIEPKAIHELGLKELARIRRAMEALGPAALGTADFREIQGRLRGHDPAMFFTTREDVEETARAALARAAAAMPRFLGRLPRTPCEVKRIEPHEEKDAPIAYYRPPAVDGSRPGTYYVNTYAPETRPRFEAEALAFHEAIPGHHVQIALAQEMVGVPEFQKHVGVTAFIEGWGLYAEGLADELGLYGSPLTRMGRLGMEAWRAARLVVDTGIHALGWSRAQAVRFMIDNTTSATNNIENEVDRYIGWPGQALAYKLGELELRRLRREAQQRLGARFDLRLFHDVVLGQGALSFPVLATEVAHWTDAELAKGGPTTPSP